MNHPGRGRWDRRLSRGERHAAQRAAILDAAGRASALHGRGLTLSHIVDGAGVGRNTFYDHFTDVESAIREAEARRLEGTTHAMERAARAARTPIEQLRSIVRAWTAAALEGPGLADVLARGAVESTLGAGSAGVESALLGALAEARAAGVIGRAPDTIRLGCILGAFEAAARLVASGSASTVDVEDTLVDLTLRAFR